MINIKIEGMEENIRTQTELIGKLQEQNETRNILTKPRPVPTWGGESFESYKN